MIKPLSKGEETLAFQLKVEGIRFEREYAFYPGRKWKLDFFLPLYHKFAIEVEGGVWSNKSRHRTGQGFLDDMEKYNHAAICGIIVLRFSTEQVESGEAIQFIKKAIQ